MIALIKLDHVLTASFLFDLLIMIFLWIVLAEESAVDPAVALLEQLVYLPLLKACFNSSLALEQNGFHGY